MSQDIISEISPELTIPDDLLEAAQIGGRVVPFVGASVSRLAGCPSWEELADKCLQYLVDKRKLNYCDLEQLKHLPPRIKLSLAKNLQDNTTQINFEEILKLNPEKCNRVYHPLEKLSTTFVSTNYDPALKTIRAHPYQSADKDNPKERRIICRKNDLSPDLLLSENIAIHIHGHVEDRDSMVMTTTDYLEHYAFSNSPKENPLITFLQFLFKTRNVLFVGYGLSELEILEYAFSKTRIKASGKPQHYLLQGFYSNQVALANHLRSYFNELGIQLIPFLLDTLNWEQLIRVLEHLSSKITGKPILPIEKQIAMEDMLNND